MGGRHRANQIYGGDKASSEHLVSGLGLVNISERSRIQLERLLSLEKKKVDQYALLVELKPILLPPSKLFSGKTYFSVYLKDEHGRISERPVVDRALYSVGGKGVLPWIEIGYYWDEVIFKKEGTPHLLWGTTDHHLPRRPRCKPFDFSMVNSSALLKATFPSSSSALTLQ